ncbi:hypothetical protein CHGG_09029 [Chaetomium globosum CBS 148.51]|uniref:Peroxin 20 n=1 Tax=Chaetomium globosum (strain ATCC 6205 / CBS 148.51 / DSM 1962 / NBRC 6347 / NRRL 1970) TaxID=306901 RepID=Q2GSM5_CHAGB|nr:uncharacterized protein CHGG_09029 [Chaetomium globosum CBS 148.51]EAQ85015.1 hypothetical protein CHGG_09029 [Chaetomium globosum CBS 148.51]
MADSMCGPSNGAKNLLSHVDRDRTHHQDRFVNAPQAGPGNAFRSQAPFANGAETAFGGFQQGGAPMDSAFGPGLDMNTIAGARAYGHPAPAAPTAMTNIGPGVPAARLASPATGGTSHQEWVNQFSGMQIGGARAGPSTAIAPQMQSTPMAAMNPAMNMQQAAFGMPMYNGLSAGVYGLQGMNPIAQQQPQIAVAQDSDLDVEAFNRAFGEYDDVNFKTELADWTEKQQVANTEFAEAQDKWMAQHGPRVDPTTGVTVPSPDEMEAIDANLEKLAQEQDKRRSDDDLVHAAIDIVNSVSDNTSEKFKNSRFFELMRRIGNREVVVEGDGFVNAATGEAVNTSHDDEQHDSGLGSDAATPQKAPEVQPA